MSGPTKEPRELWDEAKGDPERYAALMVEHGHVVPFECPQCAVTKRHRHDGGTIVWTDIFGHDAARAAAPAGEDDPRNLTDDERRVCGNCPHVKYDHFMPGSERCEISECPCPGFLTVPPAPDRAGLREALTDAMEAHEDGRRGGAYPHLGQTNDIRLFVDWIVDWMEKFTPAALAASPAPEPTGLDAASQIDAIETALATIDPRGSFWDHRLGGVLLTNHGLAVALVGILNPPARLTDSGATDGE